MVATSGRRQSHKISAIQLVVNEGGVQQLGLLTQITPDPGLRVCGPGFNERTVQVQFGGALYVVFREDLTEFGVLQAQEPSPGSKNGRQA